MTYMISNWRKGEGRTVAASPHDAKDNPGTLRTISFGRPTNSPQKGRPDDGSDEFFGEIKGEKRYGNSLKVSVALALGVRGYPNSTLPKSAVLKAMEKLPEPKQLTE